MGPNGNRIRLKLPAKSGLSILDCARVGDWYSQITINKSGVCMVGTGLFTFGMSPLAASAWNCASTND